jgi:very-short-patch-repair endonuclease
LSHRTAAAVWGLRDINTRRIELTVPGCRRRSRGRLTIHHTADATLVRTKDDLRVSSVPGLLIELAPRESAGELDRLITLSVRKRILNLEKMQAALARQGRRPGIGKLKRALADYLPRPDRKSDLERAFDELLARHPEIPQPQRNIYLGGWEIDCYWPEQRLAVELDGRPYHMAVRDIERDRLKDAKLLKAGIRVLRITDSRFELDPLEALGDLSAALGLSPS